MARSGTEPIYSDFCDQFIEHNPTIENTSGPINTGYLYQMEHLRYMNKDTEWLCPFKSPFHIMYDPENRNLITKTFWEQEFKSYKVDIPKQDIILIHARDTDKWGSKNRNWPHNNWNELVSRTKENLPSTKIISIGSISASFCPEDAADKRGVNMNELIELMSMARLIVGTSSGPLHMATLCELPQLVISSPHNIIRYTKDWNPFKIQVKMSTLYNWNPPTDYILYELLSFIKESNI
jgi:hypothetical protein